MEVSVKLAPGLRRAAVAALACTAILFPAMALASPGSAPAAGAATVIPRCHRAGLTAWLGIPRGFTNGSDYYQLEISNISGTTCTLYGYPGVSAVNAHGRQLGRAAAREHTVTTRLVTLAPGATAHAVLWISHIYDFGPAICHPATAAGLRVYAPGDYSALELPFSFRACTKRGMAYLHVTTTVAGTGIPGSTG